MMPLGPRRLEPQVLAVERVNSTKKVNTYSATLLFVVIAVIERMHHTVSFKDI